MKTIPFIYCTFLSLILSSCTHFHSATVTETQIKDPHVGWNGYQINIPAGYRVHQPDNPNMNCPDWIIELRKDVARESKGYTAQFNTTMNFHERFLLEETTWQSHIHFLVDVLSSPANTRWDKYHFFAKPWEHYTGTQKTYFLNRVISWKKVQLNDSEAEHELININGQRGFRLRGQYHPYFKKRAQTVHYEGYYLLGNLKENFWIEGFSSPVGREKMQQAVKEMAESLQINP